MKYLFYLIFLFPMHIYCQDTINVGQSFDNFKNLEWGTQKDLIYTEVNGKILSVTLKIRETKKIMIDNHNYVLFHHSWHLGNPEMNGWFEYLCEPTTLKPVQHIRMTKKNGKEAYKFSDNKILGLDTAVNNTINDFEYDLTVPTFNWEIDLETYSLLPMQEDYHVVMNFYHPGGQEPKYYHLKVIGSDQVVLPDGAKMDCWIIFTDYGGTQPTKFWYTKQGQNFVKMEGKYKQLTIRKERIF